MGRMPSLCCGASARASGEGAFRRIAAGCRGGARCRSTRRRGDGHEWDALAGVWQCRVCLKVSFADPCGAARRERCTGGSRLAATAAASSRNGHCLWGFATADAPAVFCVWCGACSAYRVANLGKECPRRPGPAAASRLRRVARGAHPKAERAISRVCPLSASAVGNDAGQPSPYFDAARVSDGGCRAVPRGVVTVDERMSVNDAPEAGKVCKLVHAACSSSHVATSGPPCLALASVVSGIRMPPRFLALLERVRARRMAEGSEGGASPDAAVCGREAAVERGTRRGHRAQCPRSQYVFIPTGLRHRCRWHAAAMRVCRARRSSSLSRHLCRAPRAQGGACAGSVPRLASSRLQWPRRSSRKGCG